MSKQDSFTKHDLDSTSRIWVGKTPSDFIPFGKSFDELWEMHPTDYHVIKIQDKLVKTPRWQQAYGKDYAYTGQTNKALPVPTILEPLLLWVQTAIEAKLNGMLLNWYDASMGHYIGKHRDSTINMVNNCPIVTVSLGETRHFRMRPVGGDGFKDFIVDHGSAIIIPYKTNSLWTHEVPKSPKYTGKRISVTVRGFEN